jgi:hypothetical protein
MNGYNNISPWKDANYIRDMQYKGVKYGPDSPLFLKEAGKTQIADYRVDLMMKDVAVRAGFVDESNNGHTQNPVSPHSLRESFGSILINSGLPDTIVDFLLGHEIGNMARVYKEGQFDSLKKMYLDREHLLSIIKTADTTELKESITAEVKKEAKDWYGNVLEDNIKMRYQLDNLNKKVSGWEDRFAKYEKFTHKFIDMTPDELTDLVKMVKERKSIDEDMRKDQPVSSINF